MAKVKYGGAAPAAATSPTDKLRGSQPAGPGSSRSHIQLRRDPVKDFRFHDLRHHGATMALNAGFTAPIVIALGGWKAERMMRRYAAVIDATLRAAAEAVAGSVVLSIPHAVGRRE